MEQKDYKAISEIIKMRKEKFAISDLPIKEFGIPYKMACDEIAKDLANYFEKEDKGYTTKKSGSGIKWETNFNREQFLKDCGV